ncbi:hypothetical protein BT96DRAFT_1015377 [Gymnopus androsaceus JB14]|uniref:F-box domain-containing protein n=1 Tax=Gymnopus androsaceus JB14 TaxID=1447944 RepID=A0A6A4I4H9_9AGAR|nr:hypothetical protein BT96DRAFT_1015377 [Gymnopus androsaceus JB14]
MALLIGGPKTHIKDRIGRLINRFSHRSFADRESNIPRVIQDCADENHQSFADRETTIPRVIKDCVDENTQALNSPIQQLPLELLQIIFDYVCECNLLHCLESSAPTGPPTKLKTPATKLPVPLSLIPALSIGSTCTEWYSIACSTPSLWSRFELEISCRSSQKVVCFTKIVQLFLERSGKDFLTIRLHLKGLDRLVHSPVMHLLLQRSHRWQILQYDGDLTISDHIPIGFQFTKLQAIEVQRVTPGADRLEPFALAPKLRTLGIPSIGPTTTPLLKRITTLQTFMDSFYDFADHCPRLTTATLWAQKKKWAPSFSLLQTHRCLVHLRTLRLGLYDLDMENNLLKYMLSSFNLPALTELHMHARHVTSSPCVWPQHQFTLFLSNSSCQITTLVLLQMRIPCQDLISILGCLPSLTYLHISDQFILPDQSPITPELICNLCWSTESGCLRLVPRLSCLVLDFYGKSFDDAGFANAVVSRWAPDPKMAKALGIECLRAVVLHCYNYQVDTSSYKVLRFLENEGLRVVVYSRGY